MIHLMDWMTMLAKSGRGVRGGCVGFFFTSLLADGSSAGVP